LSLHKSWDKLDDCDFSEDVLAVQFVAVRIFDVFADFSIICGILVTAKFVDELLFSDSSSI